MDQTDFSNKLRDILKRYAVEVRGADDISIPLLTTEGEIIALIAVASLPDITAEPGNFKGKAVRG